MPTKTKKQTRAVKKKKLTEQEVAALLHGIMEETKRRRSKITYRIWDIFHTIYLFINFYRARLHLGWYSIFHKPRHVKNEEDRVLFLHHPPDLKDLDKMGVFDNNFVPLVDLGAFPLKKIRSGCIDFKGLSKRGIKHIVLMEDRNPLFFLNYESYDPEGFIPLNEHGNHPDVEAKGDWTMKDMKKLIACLHKVKIKVHIGFWGNYASADYNDFIRENKKVFEPLIPSSDDLNPLVMVRYNGIECSFAEYVANQYKKIQKDFGFDGLFLGDGLMGYRSFVLPHLNEDFTYTQPGWEYFFETLAHEVHKTNGLLWSFDVMGRRFQRAPITGIDYEKIMKHLDILVFQSYGLVAWNKYMQLPKYTFERDVEAAISFPDKILKKSVYCLELGDTVEGWHGSYMNALKQHKTYGHLFAGGLGVWSNEVVREIIDKG